MKDRYIISKDDKVLVTGSSGFIGARVVECLLNYGFTNIRCFVRPSSRLEGLQTVLKKFLTPPTVEFVRGDLLSRDDCKMAAEGVSVILHLAAGFEKSFAGAYMNSALATRNLLDGFLDYGKAQRFVNVSSFAVYSNLKMKRGALLDETCELEDRPQERYDAYGFGKLKQEEIVREYGQKRSLPYVIVRPGAVFGPGKRDLSGRVGINTFGFFVHLGRANELPLTYVDNCAEAIVLAGLTPEIDGEIFNVVDDERMSSRKFLAAYKGAKRSFSISVPYPIAYAFCSLWEDYSKRTRGQLPPVFNRRRCAAEWKGNRYSNEKLHRLLGWTPKVKMAEAVHSFLSQYQ